MVDPVVVVNISISSLYRDKADEIVRLLKNYAKGFGGEVINVKKNPVPTVSLSIDVRTPENRLSNMRKKELRKFLANNIEHAADVFTLI